MTLADALVFNENETEAHWNEEAKALISGITLYVCHDDAEHRTLSSVRDYLMLAPDDFAHNDAGEREPRRIDRARRQPLFEQIAP